MDGYTRCMTRWQCNRAGSRNPSAGCTSIQREGDPFDVGVIEGGNIYVEVGISWFEEGRGGDILG